MTAPSPVVFHRDRVATHPGFQAQDHRASLARAWSRIDRGETVERCESCRTEMDVRVPAHGVGCPENNQ